MEVAAGYHVPSGAGSRIDSGGFSSLSKYLRHVEEGQRLCLLDRGSRATLFASVDNKQSWQRCSSTRSGAYGLGDAGHYLMHNNKRTKSVCVHMRTARMKAAGSPLVRDAVAYEGVRVWASVGNVGEASAGCSTDDGA